MIKKIIVTPSRSINLFKKGIEYEFVHAINRLYVTTTYYETSTSREEVIRYECIDTLTEGTPSPHLWDGTCWKDAGHWEVIEIHHEPKEEIITE